jgi:hypothetical protein
MLEFAESKKYRVSKGKVLVMIREEKGAFIRR